VARSRPIRRIFSLSRSLTMNWG